MSFEQKNNKSQKSFQVTRRYSTRQIMELTEKRRKQMDEEARLKKLAAPPAETQDTQAQAEIPETPKVVELKSNTPQPPVMPVITEIRPQSPIPAGQTQEADPQSLSEPEPEKPAAPKEKIVISMAQKPAEEMVAEIINEQLDEASQEAAPMEAEATARPHSNDHVVVQKAASFVRESEGRSSGDPEMQFVPMQPGAATPKMKKSADPVAVLNYILEAVFYASSFVLMALMMVHLLQIGWSRYYYDQSPFILMMALCMLWISRRNFVKRTQWFWGSTVIIAGGIGVFIASALEGQTYIELASFLIVSFGIFLWRYREECACRLFFPLLSLMFIYAPPGVWEQVTIAPLNEWVYHASAWAINSVHIPVQYDGQHLHVATGSIYFAGDPTAFRSITVAAVLAIACLTFQNMAIAWSAVLLVSVVFWALLGNVIRVTITGMMLDNFGLEYASMFYLEYSVFVVMFIILAGLALTSGLLPHQEDFE